MDGIRKTGMGWGMRLLSATAATAVVVSGTYAWNGLVASVGDSVSLAKWNELISRNEPVMAHYYVGSVQHCNNGNQSPAWCVVNFNSKEYDTHNAVTTWSAWKFTAPVSGTYRITTTITTASLNWWNASNSVWATLQKNGTAIKTLDGRFLVTTISTGGVINASVTVKADAGDYLSMLFTPWAPGGNWVDLAASSVGSWIAIERVGP